MNCMKRFYFLVNFVFHIAKKVEKSLTLGPSFVSSLMCLLPPRPQQQSPSLRLRVGRGKWSPPRWCSSSWLSSVFKSSMSISFFSFFNRNLHHLWCWEVISSIFFCRWRKEREREETWICLEWTAAFTAQLDTTFVRLFSFLFGHVPRRQKMFNKRRFDVGSIRSWKPV